MPFPARLNITESRAPFCSRISSGKTGAPTSHCVEHDPDSPALVSSACKHGRVSNRPVEPHSGGMWLVPFA
jgi:hypothetical protein